jgi:broad specificity phosphatase PhoE
MRKFFYPLFLILCLPCAGVSSLAQGAPTVVLVVRHAEKVADGSADPELSEAGQKRAQALADVAEEAGVVAVYTTQFKRTRETARPLAERLKIPAVVVEATRENARTHPAALAKQILAKHAGQTVLVVGHSNTVPLIVEALGGRRPPDLDDATEFDRLFVVIVPKDGRAQVVRARYGEAGIKP